jgi:hypothetical protein
MVLQRVRSNLAEKLSSARLTPFTPTERKVVVNQILQGSLWFILSLWKGNDKELKELETQMVNFIWAGQKEYRQLQVDAVTLTNSKKEGGIGLTNVRDQVKCMLVRCLIWAISDGSHPLQIILRHRIRELSFRKWGVKDYSWLYNACQTLKQQGSKLWQNIVQAWSQVSKCTALCGLKQAADISTLPLWTQV